MAFNKTLMAAALSAGLFAMTGAASAAVVGGGATLPEDLYNGTNSTNTNGILTKTPPGFNFYVGVGSGAGKRAFFNNDSEEFDLAPGITVDYAGSDSLVTQAERAAYDANTTEGAASFGPLVQIPTVLTSVTVPINVQNASGDPLPVNLTSAQLAGIFAGTIVNWSAIIPSVNQPITVVFRKEGSGTTEIFLRHLKAVSPGSIPAANPGNDFAAAYGFDPELPPARFVAAEGSDAVADTVAATPFSIGYVSPDKVEYDNPEQVASIGGLLPTQANVQAAVDSDPDLAPPTGAAVQNAENWGVGYVASGTSPIANPGSGYPIVGVTNLILSQCYQDSADLNQIRQFLAQHYAPASTVNDQAIEDHSFIKLPQNWRTAVYNTFFNTTSSLRIGNPDVCNTIGRPL